VGGWVMGDRWVGVGDGGMVSDGWGVIGGG